MDSIWKGIEAVIFDMDGLLVDTEPLHLEASNLILQEYGESLEPGSNERFIGLGDHRFWTIIKEEFGIADPIPDLRERRMAYMMRLIREKPPQCMRGAPQLVRACRSRGYKTAVASSTPLKQVHAILECALLRGEFHAIVSGEMEEVREGKPAPDIFLYTAKLLAVPPGRCLVFEDSAPGVIAAASAGMRVVAVPNDATRRADFSRASLVIESLSSVSPPARLRETA